MIKRKVITCDICGEDITHISPINHRFIFKEEYIADWWSSDSAKIKRHMCHDCYINFRVWVRKMKGVL